MTNINYCDICGELTEVTEKFHHISFNYYNICDKKKCENIVEKENKADDGYWIDNTKGGK